MSHNSPVLPSLIINRSFMTEFVRAEPPCFALGLVEEENRQCGFLGLRPNQTIPAEITEGGFSFGHSLLGNDTYEVIHFAFEFYGYQTYNVLLNPSNPIVRAVLKTMIFGGDYFFFALDAKTGRATAFRAEIEQDILIYLKANLSRLMNSTTTDKQYQIAGAHFLKNPHPEGVLLDWVCRDNIDYLDFSADPMVLTPATE
jgi:hypothetical protein